MKLEYDRITRGFEKPEAIMAGIHRTIIGDYENYENMAFIIS